jgi:uncharacterized membrane protein YhaH (DUF805 family)
MTDVPPPPPPANYGGGAPQPMSNPLVGYWKRVVLERYAQFAGRAGRAEFWWYFLAALIIGIVFNVLIAISNVFWVIYAIYGLAVLIPGLAVGVRRLHDTDKSGWWLLIALVPLVGIIVLIVFWATEGTPAPNRYGPPDIA